MQRIIKIFKFSILLVFLIFVVYFTSRGLKLIEYSVTVAATYAQSLPQPRIEEKSGEPSKIYDRHGNFLYEIHGDIRRKNINLAEVPIKIQQAFIAAEDQSFYTHRGVSAKNIIASVQENLQSEEIERGASTIPMQLTRNLVLSNEKTFERKIKEIIISLLINVRYSKEQILERYLNEIPVGGNLVGIATATETYFQKEVSDLTLLEGATIAALINAPSRLSPYNSEQNLRERTEYILNEMVELNFISRSEAENTKRNNLSFAPDIETIKYPYFVMYLKKYLEEKYGQEKIEYGGLNIRSTLDPKLQEIGEKVIEEKIDENATKWNAHDAGLIVMDPKTGQILAMVGGKDYWDSQVNITISKRQPGSSIKPFIYLSAFEQGYSDKTQTLDRVRDFGGGYKPENYGGGATGKWWSIRHALIQSLNVPAVATLEKVGIPSTVNTLKEIGFSSLDESYFYGLSFALGTTEITPIEMVTAASTLANGGKKVNPINFLKIEKNNGNILTSNEWIKAEKQIVGKNSVALVNNIISDYKTKQFFYKTEWYKNYTLSDRVAAAKTGTSSGPRDCWLVGYTPNLVTIVWTGNNDGTLMKHDADGINVAAPIWNAFMTEALKDYPIEEFEKPEEVELDENHKNIGMF